MHVYIYIMSIGFSNGQSNFHQTLADSALILIRQEVSYDPTYRVIYYPNGDVPADKGVCTDG